MRQKPLKVKWDLNPVRLQKRMLMRDNGITSGRQWRKFRRLHGLATPKQWRRAQARAR